jgi:hypothetical protein
MRRVWATAGAVWAVLGITAALAWTRGPVSPAPPATTAVGTHATTASSAVAAQGGAGVAAPSRTVTATAPLATTRTS